MTILHTLQEIPEQLPEVDLPGGVSPFLRAFFSVPQGVQMAGGILAGLVGFLLLVVVIRKRVPIGAWFRARTRPLQIGLVLAGAITLFLVAAGGTVSWNYMQHDNDFCTGCHVMGGAVQRFTESGHSELSCHDCHRQSIFASMRQLHLWVRDRPAEIGEHSPVPTAICSECHIDDDPADNWTQIAATSGHVAHLESDSTALADVQCVTCHGQEVHQFRPADQTCGQAECHSNEDTRIVLGEMTQEAGLHCVTCHEFTAERIAPTQLDSVTGLLTPGLAQCTSCHEMEALWADYDPFLDPHDARCGACHNPHEQDRPEVALRACTDAGCHARPDTLSTLHVGLQEAVGADCIGCHAPHVWVRDGNDCASCHAEMLAGVASLTPPARPTGLIALPRGSASTFRHVAVDARVHGPSASMQTGKFSVAASSTDGSSVGVAASVAQSVQQQSFTHGEHTDVECTACHSNRTRHGEVTVRTQSDCFSCHHATQTAGAQGCGDCHSQDDLGRVQQVPATLRLSVWEGERLRALPFDHDAHTELRCVDCHGGGTRQRVQTSCTACHEDHHRPDGLADCASCHEEHRTDAHTAEVHTDGCTGSGCHTEPRFSRMEKTREFCVACHQDQTDHEPAQSCMNCHLVPANAAR